MLIALNCSTFPLFLPFLFFATAITTTTNPIPFLNPYQQPTTTSKPRIWCKNVEKIKIFLWNKINIKHWMNIIFCVENQKIVLNGFILIIRSYWLKTEVKNKLTLVLLNLWRLSITYFLLNIFDNRIKVENCFFL